MCEDVLEGDEGLSERVEFIHGGVDAVETWTSSRNLLTVGDSEEEPAVNLKHLPVRRSHRLHRDDHISSNNHYVTTCGAFIKLMNPEIIITLSWTLIFTDLVLLMSACPTVCKDSCHH